MGVLVRLSGAEVMAVSAVSCWGRAVVLLVSPSPCFCVLCATLFALLGLMWDVSAKKFAQHTKNGSKWVFDGALGELLRGNAAGAAVRGEYFRGNAAGAAVLGEYFRGPAVVGSRRASFVAPCAWQPGPSTGSVNPSMRS